MNYLKQFGTRHVPQWLPLRGQVPTSAGGNVWAVDVWTRLRRFLILGSEGGSYYASEWTLTRENAQAVGQAVAEDGQRAIAEIVRVSREGRAPKSDPALFASTAAGRGRATARPRSTRCRGRPNGTHLFQFATFVEGFRAGAGRFAARSALVRAQPSDGRVPGGEVPPPRATIATCCDWHTRVRVSAPEPDARRVGRPRPAVRVDRPGWSDGRSPAHRRGLRACAGVDVAA